MKYFQTLLVRRGGGEAISLGLPIESGVVALKILIEGAVEHAVLYPSNEGESMQRPTSLFQTNQLFFSYPITSHTCTNDLVM